MLTGRHDCDYVEIVGVVQRAWLSSDPKSIHTLFADVAFEEGVVRATFWDYSPADLERLIDARVRLRGNVGTLFGRTEQLRGVSLFVGRTSDVEVLSPPPDPFWLPTRSISSIYNYSAAGEVNRRIRVRGVVTGYMPGPHRRVSDFTEHRDVPLRPPRPLCGRRHGQRADRDRAAAARAGRARSSRLQASPRSRPGKPILTNAIFRVVGEASSRRRRYR